MGWKSSLATLALFSSMSTTQAQSIVCPYYAPYNKYVDIVVPHTHPDNGFSIYLDAGHFKGDRNGYKSEEINEYELTLKVAKQLKPLLEHLGYTVYLSRETEDPINIPRKYFGGSRNRSIQELKARRKKAEELDVDMLISIHFNSHAWKTSYKGWETWTYGYNSYRRNRNKGKQFFKDPRTRYYSGSSRELGDAIHNYINEFTPLESTRKAGIISAIMGFRHYDLRDMWRPKRNEGEKQMAIVLLELAYMTNPEDRRYVLDNTDDFAPMIAGAMTYNPFMVKQVLTRPYDGVVNLRLDSVPQTSLPKYIDVSKHMMQRKKKKGFFKKLFGRN